MKKKNWKKKLKKKGIRGKSWKRKDKKSKKRNGKKKNEKINELEKLENLTFESSIISEEPFTVIPFQNKRK